MIRPGRRPISVLKALARLLRAVAQVAPARPLYRRLIHRSVTQRRLLLARMARDRERPGLAA